MSTLKESLNNLKEVGRSNKVSSPVTLKGVMVNSIKAVYNSPTHIRDIRDIAKGAVIVSGREVKKFIKEVNEEAKTDR